MSDFDIQKKENVQGFSDNRFIRQSKKNRESILDLQNKMQAMESTLDQFPLTHHFAPGVYAREMFLPAGHTIIGKIHKHAHLNIISQGTVVVSTESGSEELKAPCIFTSYAGTKRAVYIKEDAIWTTIHATEKTDVDDIESDIIAKNYDELGSGKTINIESDK